MKKKEKFFRYEVAIFSSPKGPELHAPCFLYPNKSVPEKYCNKISKLTKVVQIQEDKKNFLECPFRQQV